jgi:hypothetical protein
MEKKESDVKDRALRATVDEDGQHASSSIAIHHLIGWPSGAARVGTALVDPIDDRLNLRSGKERHPRRVRVGGHLSERTGVVVEQRSDPLQRLHEVGVRAGPDDKDWIGCVWAKFYPWDVSSCKIFVAQRVPEIRVGRGRDTACFVVLIENTVDVSAERQSAAANLFSTLYQRSIDGTDPLEKLDAVEAHSIGDQMSVLRAVINDIRSESNFPRDAETFAYWLPRVSRFSFEIGRVINRSSRIFA